MKKLLLFIILLTVFGYDIAIAQGLRFFGNEKTISERSSLLIPGESNKAVRNFEIEFDLRIDNPSSPGYIFHVKNRQGGDAFSLMYRKDFQTDSVTISFTKDGEKSLMELRESLRNVREHSLHVRVRIDCMADIANVDLGPHSFECRNLGLSKNGLMPELYFGINRHIVETASYVLRNLEIASDEKRLVIPLNERGGTEVHSSDGRVVGKIDNPNWLIDSHRKWEPLIKFSSQTPTGIAFDREHNRFYSYNADTLRTYDVLTNELQATAMEGNGKLPTKFGMNFYDPWRGKIIPYEIYYNNMSAEIDPATGKWEMSNRKESDMVAHHHAHGLLPGGKEAILFGGYGDRMYFNSILRFNPSELTFDTLKIGGDIIPPRFFAGMMLTNSGDSVYIYGGKGNNEGKQDLGVRYYYDLYLVDLKNGISKKLWERPAPEKDRVPARTLIGCPEGGSFYAMAYSEYEPHTSLQLYKIDMATGEEIAVGDTISMISEEIATNVALYRAPSLDKLFCVVQEFEKYGETTTRIYSITTPVLPLAANNEGSERHSGFWEWIWLCVAIVIAGCLLYAVALIIRNHHGRLVRLGEHARTFGDIGNKDDMYDETPGAGIAAIEPAGGHKCASLPDSNRISLFGPFNVMSKDGKDITYMFSPKLKIIFIYILLNTIEKKGVASSDLNSVFWSDKDPDKVKNLRNVTINKIRKILGDINGIELVYDQGLFKIALNEDCFCDICKVYELSSSLREVCLSKEKSDLLGEIFLQGKFLIGSEDPVFDYFRQNIEGYIESFLTETASECYKAGKYEKVRYLCNTLLKADPLSETALRYVVLACRASGRNDIAAAMYASFVKDYKKMMGEDYPVELEDIR